MTFGEATDAEIEQRRRETLAYLLPVDEPVKIGLGQEEIRYLKTIRDNPGMKILKIDEMLDIRSNGKARAYRKRLGEEDLKLIQHENVYVPGRGMSFKNLHLTEKGAKLLDQLGLESNGNQMESNGPGRN